MSLECAKLKEAELEQLADCLSSSPCVLKALSLSECEVGRRAEVNLVTGLEQKVEIEPHGCGASRLLLENPKLATLRLYNCKAGKGVETSLAEAFRAAKSLVFIYTDNLRCRNIYISVQVFCFCCVFCWNPFNCHVNLLACNRLLWTSTGSTMGCWLPRYLRSATTPPLSASPSRAPLTPSPSLATLSSSRCHSPCHPPPSSPA